MIERICKTTYGCLHIFRNNMDEESSPVADNLEQLLEKENTKARTKDGGETNSAVPQSLT